MSLYNKSGLGLVVLGIFMGCVGATLAAAPLSGFFRCWGNPIDCPSGVFVVATLRGCHQIHVVAINKVV